MAVCFRASSRALNEKEIDMLIGVTTAKTFSSSWDNDGIWYLSKASHFPQWKSIHARAAKRTILRKQKEEERKDREEERKIRAEQREEKDYAMKEKDYAMNEFEKITDLLRKNRQDLSDPTLSLDEREDLLCTQQLLMSQKKKLQQTLFSTNY